MRHSQPPPAKINYQPLGANLQEKDNDSRARRDNGLFITLVLKVLYERFFYSLIKQLLLHELILIGWFKMLSVQTFQPLILQYLHRLSYAFRSLH